MVPAGGVLVQSPPEHTPELRLCGGPASPAREQSDLVLLRNVLRGLGRSPLWVLVFSPANDFMPVQARSFAWSPSAFVRFALS